MIKAKIKRVGKVKHMIGKTRRVKKTKTKTNNRQQQQQQQQQGRRLKQTEQIATTDKVEEYTGNTGFDYWYTMLQNITDTLKQTKANIIKSPRAFNISANPNNFTVSLKMQDVNQAIRVYNQLNTVKAGGGVDGSLIINRRVDDVVEFVGSSQKFRKRVRVVSGGVKVKGQSTNKPINTTTHKYTHCEIEEYFKRRLFVSSLNLFKFDDKLRASDDTRESIRKAVRRNNLPIDCYFRGLYAVIKNFSKLYWGVTVSEQQILIELFDICKNSEDVEVKAWYNNYVACNIRTYAKSVSGPYYVIESLFVEKKMKLFNELVRDNVSVLKGNGLYVYE